MSKHFDEIVKLLAGGHVPQAQRYITEAIEPALVALQQERDLCVQMVNQKRQASGAPSLPPQPPHRLRLRSRASLRMPKDERRRVIKQVAYDRAKANGWKVVIDDVAKDVAAAGYDLGTTVPGTMIGNVLFKAEGEWERVTKGVFKYVGDKK